MAQTKQSCINTVEDKSTSGMGPTMLDQKIKDYLFEELSENSKLMQLYWNLFVRYLVTGDEIWIY